MLTCFPVEVVQAEVEAPPTRKKIHSSMHAGVTGYGTTDGMPRTSSCEVSRSRESDSSIFKLACKPVTSRAGDGALFVVICVSAKRTELLLPPNSSTSYQIRRTDRPCSMALSQSTGEVKDFIVRY